MFAIFEGICAIRKKDLSSLSPNFFIALNVGEKNAKSLLQTYRNYALALKSPRELIYAKLNSFKETKLIR